VADITASSETCGWLGHYWQLGVLKLWVREFVFVREKGGCGTLGVRQMAAL
jgi:hypothetical protein